MTAAFLILSALTLAAAIGAVAFRNPIHCVLSLVIAFAGLAGHYLRLNAQFVGLAQLLVYIGAVAILIVFAILLTRSGNTGTERRWSARWLAGVGIAAGMAALLMTAVCRSNALVRPIAEAPAAPMRQIGDQLMGRYVLPLEIAGVLLTAALIAAIILALPNREGGEQ